MDNVITINVELAGKIWERNFRTESKARQFVRRLARRGTPVQTRITETRGAQQESFYLGTHPVVVDWHEDENGEYRYVH